MAFPLYTRNPTATVTDIGSGGGAGDIVGWSICNTNASTMFVQVFAKKASTVTIGTTTPDMVLSLVTNTNYAATLVIGNGLHSEAGWSFAVTTTDNGSTGMTYGNPIDITWFLN